jgi:hypothetical protein
MSITFSNFRGFMQVTKSRLGGNGRKHAQYGKFRLQPRLPALFPEVIEADLLLQKLLAGGQIV